MRGDFLDRARMALHDMQGRVEAGKLEMFDRTIKHAQALEARAKKAEAERDARGRKLNTALYGEPHFGVQALEARIEALEAERDALRELLSETAEYLFVAASEGSHERFDARLRVFRRARAALNREPDT